MRRHKELKEIFTMRLRFIVQSKERTFKITGKAVLAELKRLKVCFIHVSRSKTFLISQEWYLIGPVVALKSRQNQS